MQSRASLNSFTTFSFMLQPVSSLLSIHSVQDLLDAVQGVVELLHHLLVHVATCFLSLDPSVWRQFGDTRNRVKVSVQEVEEVEQGVEAFNQIAVEHGVEACQDFFQLVYFLLRVGFYFLGCRDDCCYG